MTFSEKLKKLRTDHALTQEELAERIFVTRTAVSKWESGRGYPNIDSLKAMASAFGVTIDELLSGDELLTIAEEDTRRTAHHFRDLLFGLLDCSIALFFFLPLFGQKVGATVREVSLLSLTEIAVYLKIAYTAVVLGITAFGIVTLALQNCRHHFWMRSKSVLSLAFSAVGVCLFIITKQPYAAMLLFAFLVIKTFMLLKRS